MFATEWIANIIQIDILFSLLLFFLVIKEHSYRGGIGIVVLTTFYAPVKDRQE